MAIYHKDCPRCAVTVATYITRCKCGFSFDGNEDADPSARLEALIEEERLYEEYLAARAKQAIAAATDAKAAMFEEPNLYYKSTDAEKAIATRDAVLAELSRQKLRTAEIRAAMEAVKTGSRKVHVLKPHAHKRPDQKPLEQTPVVSTPKAAAKPRVSAPPTVIPPTAPPESAVAVDAPQAKADDTRAYTAKLEEILMGTRRSEAPKPVADAVPLLLPVLQVPIPPASGRSSTKNTGIISIHEAAVSATRAATPTSTMSPEEELERAARAIRWRATEMATRHGVVGVDTPPRATPGITSHADHVGAANTNKTQPKTAATPNQIVALEPNQTVRMMGAAPTAGAKPEPVEMVASAETNSPATPKKPTADADTHQQMRAHHARTAATLRNKHGQRPVDTQVLTNAQSGPAPAPPPPPTQEVVIPEPFVSDRPSKLFRTAQAAKAEKIVQAAKANKATGPNHCPYCSATHPHEIARCGCGYIFDESFELPELALNANERAELFEGTYQIKRPKPSG